MRVNAGVDYIERQGYILCYIDFFLRFAAVVAHFPFGAGFAIIFFAKII